MDKVEQITKIKKLQRNPQAFIEKILGADTLEVYHKQICKDVIDYDRVAIKACHAVGKTWIVARLGIWFTTCYKDSIVITTAPTNRQVESLIWGQWREAVRKSKTILGGKILNKKWTISENWYALGFSPQAGASSSSDEQQGSNFQGFHAKHIMVIFDEATGIPKDIYTMAEGLLTSGVTVKWVCIANPTSTATEFFQVCKRSEWHVITINCFDSPNMIANGFTNRETLEVEIDHLKTLTDYDRMKRIKSYLKPNGHLLSAQWAVAKLFEWGFNHPLAKSKILGEFPTKGDDVIIKWDSIQAAINREPSYDYTKRFIGVDVARFGDDLTVLTEITDVTFRGKYVHHKDDTVETTGNVVRLIFAADIGKETHIIVDATGVGSGVVDNLNDLKRKKELPDNVYIHEVHFGSNITHGTEKENDKMNSQYENLKGFLFDKLNEDLRDILSMPNEEIYQEETVNIMFKFSKKGKLMVESKDDYKARNKKSPDHTDSLALANYGRYLKPNYGTFKAFDKTKGVDNFSSNFNKKSKERKSRIKINSY